jgi:DsbC/DsbD-like thiol-disulfide interchange protein
MRRNDFVLIFCSFLLLIFTACSQSENATKQAGNASAGPSSAESQGATTTKTPPADVVRASADPVEIKAGSSAEAPVKLTVANGYHINANPPSFSYLIATELTVEPSEGITPAQPVYPASVKRSFAFAKDGPLAVYEGEATIKLPLTAAGNAQKGAHNLKGKLRVQPCDEESCYKPRDIEVSLPVTVK